jgi:hypothetical protein
MRSGRLFSESFLKLEIAPTYEELAYEIVSGRRQWLNRDPIGIRGGINLYTYVRNQPINASDPLGLAGDWSNPSAGQNNVVNLVATGPVSGDGPIIIVDGGDYTFLLPAMGGYLLTPLPAIAEIVNDIDIITNPNASATDKTAAGLRATGVIMLYFGVPALATAPTIANRSVLNSFARASATDPPAALGTLGSIRGPFGTVTQQALEDASKVSTPSLRVYTNLSGPPEAGRALSVAYGDNAVALAQKATAGTGGTLYSGNIPVALINQLKSAGLAQESMTQMGNVVGNEIRFLPDATQFIIKFLTEK